MDQVSPPSYESMCTDDNNLDKSSRDQNEKSLRAAKNDTANKPLFLKLKPDLSPREKKQPLTPKRATYKIHGVNVLNRTSVDSTTAIERFQRRRESHKKSERRRSQNINAAIAELAELIPEGAPVDKGGILRCAVEHIKDLHSENDMLKSRLQAYEQGHLPPPMIPRSEHGMSVSPPTKLRKQFSDSSSPPPYLEPSPPLLPILPAYSTSPPAAMIPPIVTTPPPTSPQPPAKRPLPQSRPLMDQMPSSFGPPSAGRFQTPPSMMPSPPKSMLPQLNSPNSPPKTSQPSSQLNSFGQHLHSMIPFSVDSVYPMKRRKEMHTGESLTITAFAI